MRTEGTGNGTKITLGSIANFLYKTGYHSIMADLTVDFSYDDNQFLLLMKPAIYFGKNFINIDLSCLLGLNLKLQNFDMDILYNRLILKSGELFIKDTGLKEQFLREREYKSNLSRTDMIDKIY